MYLDGYVINTCCGCERHTLTEKLATLLTPLALGKLLIVRATGDEAAEFLDDKLADNHTFHARKKPTTQKGESQSELPLTLRILLRASE